jgi:Protein of unknown function (DUF3224)
VREKTNQQKINKGATMKPNRFLSHLSTSFCALVIVGALSTLPRAEAGTPQPASGQFFPCFNLAGPPRPVGENWIITFNVTGTITGTFVGSFVFTGSVNGSSGTLLVTYEGIGNAVNHHESLQVVVRQGTGGLAGVYANLTAEGDIGPPNPGCDLSGAGTYTGQILFAP